MVGHQLMVISLAYYNNNLALQLYFNGSTTCCLEEVMMVPNICYSESRGGVHVHPLAPVCRRPCDFLILFANSVHFSPLYSENWALPNYHGNQAGTFVKSLITQHALCDCAEMFLVDRLWISGGHEWLKFVSDHI